MLTIVLLLIYKYTMLTTGSSPFSLAKEKFLVLFVFQDYPMLYVSQPFSQLVHHIFPCIKKQVPKIFFF
ncbi:MAG: hypothetical protein D3917_14200 [Candidatus Electrothrix sp. AX5]|nr:hypothetical protein [Candidatus Electrothrix sp. AX5]